MIERNLGIKKHNLEQKNIETKIINKDSEELQKKEIKLFIVVMIAFTIGMAFLLFYDVSTWWIWYIYFVIWTLVEVRVAKNIKLKWWHWVIIIAIIISIDWIVLELIEYVKK
jgi:hypothetical protein